MFFLLILNNNNKHIIERKVINSIYTYTKNYCSLILIRNLKIKNI